jgi:uncharacterized heparinase superfamily protein
MPLRQCYVARGRNPPPALVDAIDGMIAFLKAMRLGDGTLARFNGMGRTEAAALATVIAYDPAPEAPPPPMAPSRYVRIDHGGTIVIMDVGIPMPARMIWDGCGSEPPSESARIGKNASRRWWLPGSIW